MQTPSDTSGDILNYLDEFFPKPPLFVGCAPLRQILEEVGSGIIPGGVLSYYTYVLYYHPT